MAYFPIGKLSIQYFTYQNEQLPLLMNEYNGQFNIYGCYEEYNKYGSNKRILESIYVPGVQITPDDYLLNFARLIKHCIDIIENEYQHVLNLPKMTSTKLSNLLNPQKFPYVSPIYTPMGSTILFDELYRQILKPLVEQRLKQIQEIRLQKSRENQQNKIQNYNQQQAEQRENRLIINYDFIKEQNKIYNETTKILDRKDKELVPDLFNQRVNLHPKPLPKPKPESTFTILQSLNDYPYRSNFKLKGLYHETPQKLFEALKNVVPLSQFSIKANKRKYHLKACSKTKYSFIGDVFFQSNNFDYLLLINVNTRKAYYYPLGNNYDPIQTVIDADTGKEIKTFQHSTIPKKDIDSMKKAFNEILKQTKINVLSFDGEASISSQDFQDYLYEHHIHFIPLKPGSHTSTALIDRLCRTIRDIAFNMGYDGIDNQAMKNIIEIYNSAPHKTLTKILNGKYKFKYGISPNDMNDELETAFVEQCLKYNALIKSQDDYYLKPGDKVRIYNKNLSDKLFEGSLNKTNKRSILSKDIYIVQGYEGNLIKLSKGGKSEATSARNGEIIYKPRRDLQLIQK